MSSPLPPPSWSFIISLSFSFFKCPLVLFLPSTPNLISGNTLLSSLLCSFYICKLPGFQSQAPSAFTAIPPAGIALARWLLKASQILVKNTAILGQTFSPYKQGWCFRHGKSSHPFKPQGEKIATPQCVALGGQPCEAPGIDRNKSGVSENCETCAVNVSSQQKWVSPQAWAQIWLCLLSK